MALYVTTNSSPSLDFPHYIGNTYPKFDDPNFITTVVEVQADSDELERILNKFNNIPYCKSRVVRWTGDYARFILSNWNLINS